MTAIDIEGGCYCGAVRYRASQQPLGSILCDCQACRRVAAAPSIPWLTFVAASFSFTRGSPVHFNSSAGVRRSFCGECGTPLTYVSDKTSDEIDVTTCSLDDPERFPPTHCNWVSHDLRWWPSSHALPRHAESKPNAP